MNGKKDLDGKVTISRVQGDSESITISIDDEASSCRVAQVHLSLEDFALAVTGHSFVPCKLDVFEAPFGKKRIDRMEPAIIFPKRPEDLSDKEMDEVLVLYEKDGWKADRYFNSQHQVRSISGSSEYEVTVTFFKYVEIEDDAT